ncbi:unnamed protein product [Tuber aestivum]|uniref:Uncharacterized protein n=1 Tax=Tuber aestivum TaxID=59557 RepID=A0A292PNG2_9PEZI|nr:unnamed protein product [Tuber aestivum]
MYLVHSNHPLFPPRPYPILVLSSSTQKFLTGTTAVLSLPVLLPTSRSLA